MKRDPDYVRGRSRNKTRKNCGRTRDLSIDPIYRNKNYNKLSNQKGVTGFTFVRKCNYANRIYRKLDKMLQLNMELNDYYGWQYDWFDDRPGCVRDEWDCWNYPWYRKDHDPPSPPSLTLWDFI
jgi:hypothetical protein